MHEDYCQSKPKFKRYLYLYCYKDSDGIVHLVDEPYETDLEFLGNVDDFVLSFQRLEFTKTEII